MLSNNLIKGALLKKRSLKRKVPKMALPRRIENGYASEILSYVNQWQKIIQKNVVDNVGMVVNQVEYLKPQTRQDAQDPVQLLAGFILMSQIQINETIDDAGIQALAGRIAVAVSTMNRMQLNSLFQSVIGVDLIASEPYLEAHMANFVKQNVQLIKSIKQNMLEDVEQTVLRGVQQGLRVEQIQSLIQERFGVSENRAKLIAVDQVNSLNGQLTMLRSKSVGATKYTWRTSQDERVRPAHAAREGVVFSWDNPPSDGHAGQAIRCRCTAAIILEDILED